MPRSTTFLPDVNVWLALASRRHVHALICSEWLNSIQDANLAFCRITQMGLLRLLTYKSVMGADVLSSREAWRTYRNIMTDERVEFAPEPFALEIEWTKTTLRDRPTPNLWTDAYLVAFARTAGMRLVTLDRAVASLESRALVLSS